MPMWMLLGNLEISKKWFLPQFNWFSQNKSTLHYNIKEQKKVWDQTLWSRKSETQVLWNSLAAQQVKDLMLSLQELRSLLWLRIDPWPGNFCMLWVQPISPKQTNKQQRHRSSYSWKIHRQWIRLIPQKGSLWVVSFSDLRKTFFYWLLDFRDAHFKYVPSPEVKTA